MSNVIWETIILVGLGLRREIWAGEKEELGHTDGWTQPGRAGRVKKEDKLGYSPKYDIEQKAKGEKSWKVNWKGAEQSEESPENDVIEVKRKDCSRKSCGLESQILLKSEGMRGLRSVLWISNKEPVRRFPNSTFRRVLGAAECGEWKVRTWMTIQQMTFGEKESTKAH